MIDYRKIGYAITFYERYDYQPIEMPWIASEEAVKITLPETATPTLCDLGILVGSAEQSFIQAIITSNLEGTYQATTPCFRNDEVDELHQKYFIKTELFNNVAVTEVELNKMIDHALTFFQSFEINPKVIQTGDLMYDIVDGVFDIELGSYGIRNINKKLKWIYGTGCAEPRLSIVIEKQRKHKNV